LKARLCVEGKRALYQYCIERGVPHRRCGKLVVATSSEEVDALARLNERATANGVEDIALIGAGLLKEMEPELQATGALLSGTTGILDGNALMLSVQGDAENAGATVQRRAPLLGGSLGSSSIQLRVGGDEPAEIETELLVNAGGLGAWDVSRSLDGLDPESIPPRYLGKGCYFAMSGRAHFERLIYPFRSQAASASTSPSTSGGRRASDRMWSGWRTSITHPGCRLLRRYPPLLAGAS